MIATLAATPSIDSKHWQEWIDSAVIPEIIEANVQSLYGQAALEAVLYEAIDKVGSHGHQYTTREVSWLLGQYRHLEANGGWFCAGLEFSRNKQGQWQQQRMQWGCLKPNQPRFDFERQKQIKYEHALKAQTRAFCLEVPSKPRLWLEVLANTQASIIIVEGAKKAGCLLSLGYVAIALPGVTGAVRTKDALGNRCKPYLIEEIQQFATPGRKIYICFDRDQKARTVANVNREIAKLGQLLSQAGCNVQIIQLPGPEKGVDDFVVAQGREAFDALYQNAIAFADWRIQELFELSCPADVVLNQRYLGVLEIPPTAKIVAVRSPKGSGKSFALGPLVQEAINSGRWVLIIGHRVQLVQELCNRLGLNYVTEIYSSELGTLLGFGLCIDSLHPHSQASFSANGWHDGLVIFDECEQVIWHVLGSSTCSKNRVSILGELRQLLTNVLNSSRGQVILCDADLSDLSIDFVKGMAESHTDPWIILNEWKPEESWNIFQYNQTSPIGWMAALEKHIEEGGHPFICLSAQKAKSTWGTQGIESRLRKRFPDKRILRIDSQTIGDKTHEAFGCVNSLNEILAGYDIVICSPSIETGVSIDIRGYFTSVWGCFQGVQPENSVRQALARVREPVERHVWVSRVGIERIGNGATSIKSLLRAEHEMTRSNIRLLQDADLAAIDTGFDRVALLTWAKMACRINSGMSHYRQAVLQGLSQEGHTITDAEELADGTQQLKEEMQEIRELNIQAEAELICNAQELGKTEYEILKQQRGRTKDELAAIARYELEGRYCVPLVPELVRKDGDGWYAQLRLHYYFTSGRPYLKRRDTQKLNSLVHDGKVWLPDASKAQLGTSIAILDWLGVSQLLSLDREFKGSDLQEMAEKAIAHRWEIKTALGITIKESDQPMLIAQKLLDKLGLKLACTRRERTPEGKAGARLYRLAEEQDGRQSIFERWLERDRRALEASSGNENQERDPGSVYEYISPPLDHSPPGSPQSQSPNQVTTDPPPQPGEIGSVEVSGLVSRGKIELNKDEQMKSSSEIQASVSVGSLCQWRFHIGTWEVVDVIDEQTVKVQATSGWNRNIPFTAKIDELILTSLEVA